MKVAFVHIMKTAGTFINGYMANRIFHAPNAATYNSWRHFERDWSSEELEHIRRSAGDPAYVHNHSSNWDTQTVQRFGDSGWFRFAFYRHPGDIVCSFYHWVKREGDNPLVHDMLVHRNTLDAFLYKYWTGDPDFERFHKEMDLPPYWQELDYVSVFSEEIFSDFLLCYFKHSYKGRERENVSANKGYEHYLANGEISEKTHHAFLTSKPYSDYLKLLRAPYLARRTGAA